VVGHTDAVKTGEFNVLIEPPRGDTAPKITVEHPCETYVELDPANPRRRLAALKLWAEENGVQHANVYLDDAVYKFVDDKTQRPNLPTAFWMPATVTVDAGGWQLDDVVEHSLGEVPMVAFLNRPGRRRGYRRGRSDIAGVIPIQDLINKILADAVVASEYAAYPQRWATGIEPQKDEDGNELPIQEFVAAVSRLWTEGNENAKFGSFEAADLTKYVALIEMTVRHIAAQTRTPPHYLLGQSGSFPSGESLKATETGLVAKAKRKQITFGETWEESMRLAFLYRGDTVRGAAANAETLWQDPESRSEGELVDALIKLQTIGYPLEVLWAMHGESPQQIERMRRLKSLPDRSGDGRGQGNGSQPPPDQNTTPPIDQGVSRDG
jgi:hypothetical protein